MKRFLPVLLLLLSSNHLLFAADSDDVAKHIKDLADADFESRETAQKKLAAVGARALPKLVLAHLENRDPERQRRLDALLKSAATAAIAAPATSGTVATSPPQQTSTTDSEKLALQTELRSLNDEAAKWKKVILTQQQALVVERQNAARFQGEVQKLENKILIMEKEDLRQELQTVKADLIVQKEITKRQKEKITALEKDLNDKNAQIHNLEQYKK